MMTQLIGTADSKQMAGKPGIKKEVEKALKSETLAI